MLHVLRNRIAGVLLGLTAGPAVPLIGSTATADDLPMVSNVELQPLAAQVRRLIEAAGMAGAPIESTRVAAIEEGVASGDQTTAVNRIQQSLDPLCLVFVHVNPESRVKVSAGPAAPRLIEQGWRTFLVKVHNEAGVTAELQVKSPNSLLPYRRSKGSPEPPAEIRPGQVADRFLDVAMHNKKPMNRPLSGLSLEYRIMHVFSRDAGQREAKLQFDVGQGTQDLGFRNELGILFKAEPAVKVTFGVQDYDGSPTTAAFIIRDGQNRVYPLPARRVAPDFFFHPQIYRKDGEPVVLPPGKFNVEYNRGPEYLTETKEIEVPSGVDTHRVNFKLKRWIHAAGMGWYSGDHHVHAAGCAHYEDPSQGVDPKDMMRHIMGEDLVVGCVLSWGPCWYYQKQFFEGGVSALSTEDYLMRYDVEVSGFPSSHAGHLCLLRLGEDDYTYPSETTFAYTFGEDSAKTFKGMKTDRIGQWPSWTQPVLEWGRSVGGVVGYSHSGWGLKVETDELPNHVIPPFDGIGANEYIVTVTHGACDFISAVDTPYVWELNIWYHTLNCGFRTRISGETDFPCIYGEKVGLGRAYVKVDGELDYDKWVAGIKAGRSYVSTGMSHILDMKVNGQALGEDGSELKLDEAGSVKVTARVGAYLGTEPNESVRTKPYSEKPYWHLERARIGESRKVPLEVVVNGYAAGREEILADGSIQEISFDVPIERSSWIALRILPDSHTNPVFVLVDGKPIRASRRSAEWCIESVDQCWKKKSGRIVEHERAGARAAYDRARKTYQRILAECEAD